jgi:hypothetical protein
VAFSRFLSVVFIEYTLQLGLFYYLRLNYECFIFMEGKFLSLLFIIFNSFLTITPAYIGKLL